MKTGPMELEIYSDGSKMKEKLLRFFPTEKQEPIVAAVKIACEFHKGRTRLNGEPESNHCIATGLKTAEMGLGPKTVSAAILHDILSHDEIRDKYSKIIEEKLGKEVLNLVLEVTTMKNDQAENIGQFTNLPSAQQYLLSSVSDLRVIMIKLAEKYHNLLTIDIHPKEKKENFLKEMEKIYIPLSELLGLGSIHQQLADLLLMKKYKMKYEQINIFITQKRKISEKTRDEILEDIQTICDMESVQAEIQGRTKSITSIHNKQSKYQKEGKPFKLDNILDIIAFRVITKDIEDCYKIRSLITSLYDEIEGESDDYIANPKPNGYKAIHLCLKHPQKGTLEIQILTNEMYIYNEFGPASHIAYKQSGKRYAKSTNEFEWVKKLHEQNIEEDNPIKAELFTDQVFVFTPKGDILQLTKGATVIDFAYNLHTALGNQCVGAKVNGKSVRLDTKLETGDIVEIRVDKNKKFASEEWSDYAVTNMAKEKIKRSLGKKFKVSI